MNLDNLNKEQKGGHIHRGSASYTCGSRKRQNRYNDPQNRIPYKSGSKSIQHTCSNLHKQSSRRNEKQS